MFKSLLFIIFFMFFILPLLVINGDAINVSCMWLDKSLHNLHTYDIHSNLIINAYNGITCCDEKQGMFQLIENNNVVFQKNFTFNDLGKDCDVKKDDGIYCANLDLNSFELERFFENNKTISFKLSIVYSKIASDSVELNLTNYGFDNFSIKYHNYNYSHAQCNILSKNKVWIENLQKDHVLLPQGINTQLIFYLQNNYCGFKRINYEINVPDFIAPEKPILECKALSDGKIALKWKNIKDNVKVEKIKLFKYVRKVHLNLSDSEKHLLSTKFSFEHLKSNNLSLNDFKLVSKLNPNQDLYYDQCPDCEIYYFIKVLDEYRNSNFSDICKVFSDTSKPKDLIFVEMQNSNNISLFLIGDAKYVKIEKTFYPLDKYSDSIKFVSLYLKNSFKNSFKLSIFDNFGNEIDYNVELPKWFLINFDQDKNLISSKDLYLIFSNKSTNDFISHNLDFNALKTDQRECENTKYLYVIQKSKISNSILFFTALPNPCKERISLLPILNKDFIDKNNYSIFGDYDVVQVNDSTYYILKNVSAKKEFSFGHVKIIATKSFVLSDSILNALRNIDSDSFSNLSEFINVMNSSLKLNNYELIKKDKGYDIIKINSIPILSFFTGAFTKIKKALRDEILKGFSVIVGFIALGVIVLLIIVYFLYKVGQIQKNQIKIKYHEENAGLDFEHIKKIEQKLKEKEEKKKRLQKLIEQARKSEEEIRLKKRLKD